MYVSSLFIAGFRSFGPKGERMFFGPDLTGFIGANGSGKTVVMLALQRLFGVSNEQRRICVQDFHVPHDERATPSERRLVIEAIVAFPELDHDSSGKSTVPEFFSQMAIDESGEPRCRIRLSATWANDGSADGSIEWKLHAVRTLASDYSEDRDCSELRAADRNRIQLIYIPAVRDASAQVMAFLRGRLWRAATWSDGVRAVVSDATGRMITSFGAEPSVRTVEDALVDRWAELDTGGTEWLPTLRPTVRRVEEMARRAELIFINSDQQELRERNIEELSDGQRSLLHIALTAAAIDAEGAARAEGSAGFNANVIPAPALTIVALEEPENNLSPYYLSRIIRLLEDLTHGHQAQAIISSHSASIMSRLDPEQVRYFSLEPVTRTSRVRPLDLPADDEEAEKFVREAVRSFPELYFARFVILCEGSSEEIVLPRLADALNLAIDRSFVAVVPLGGRHVKHLWRLLAGIEVPFATLLDLDLGRAGGGWGRIHDVCDQLIAIGLPPEEVLLDSDWSGETLSSLVGRPIDLRELNRWLTHLRTHLVFFAYPLDIDLSMLRAFAPHYCTLRKGQAGPSSRGDVMRAVFGSESEEPSAEFSAIYAEKEILSWYRYLFLGRGKPTTHARALSSIGADQLAADVPPELKALLESVESAVRRGE